MDDSRSTRSTSSGLAKKRYAVAGSRSYITGTADGGFTAMGSHIKGGMGGIWTPPIKLLDGYWFKVGSRWLGTPESFTSGPGYVEMSYAEQEGIRVTRLEFCPDDVAAVIIRLRLESTMAAVRTAEVQVQIRSSIMAAYPLSNSKPTAQDVDKPDVASFSQETGLLTFQDQGNPWFAKIASSPSPTRGRVGPSYWGPVPAARRASYPAAGRGSGGELSWLVDCEPGSTADLWIAIAGSHISEEDATRQLHEALKDPAGLLQKKTERRCALLERSRFELPNASLVETDTWGKLNMADLSITVPAAKIRDVNQGQAYPEPIATIDLAGVMDGFPDYVSYFGTSSGFIIFPLVTSGLWEPAKSHLRMLRDVSRLINGSSGKVVHEIHMDGSVYFGNNQAKGDTDETGLFASAVEILWRWSGDDSLRDEMYDFIKDGLSYVTTTLDGDRDGWPSGSGIAERPGMGSEEIEVAVATWDGLEALARMAESKGDVATSQWTRRAANTMRERFDTDWWMAEKGLYADSRSNAGDDAPSRRQPGWTNVASAPNQRLQQKIWTVVTPLKDKLAPAERAHAVLDALETDTFSDKAGLYLVGDGGGPDGKGVFKCWTLTTAAMAIAEANYGRLGKDQALRYMDGIADCLDIEMPGALPEVAPSPEYDPYQPMEDRMMFMQAWTSYGISWTLMSAMLGIEPDIPGARLSVVPNLPPSWPSMAVRNVRVGSGTIAVDVRRDTETTLVSVDANPPLPSTLGLVVEEGATIAEVLLDNLTCGYETHHSLRGQEIRVSADPAEHHVLVVRLANTPPSQSS